jgi:hypothetical protein
VADPVLQGLAVDEGPHEFVEAAELGLHLQKGARVPMADLILARLRTMPGLAIRRFDVALGEPGHRPRVEPAKGGAIAFAFEQDGPPRQPRLCTVENQLLVPTPIVVDGDPPLLVMVPLHVGIAGGPETAVLRGWHR